MSTLLSTGHAAIITGAASGIGLALARALAAKGVDLALADVDAAGLVAAQRELASHGVRVLTQILDVSDPLAVQQAADAFAIALGDIHLLFNNAGIEMTGAFDTLEMQDWRRTFEVNVFGVANGIRHFVPLLRRHGGRAHVVNTASTAGFWVNGNMHMPAYSASKYAVVAISEGLEQELHGTPIGVSVLCPGPVATAIAERSSRASEQLRAAVASGTTAERAAEITLAGIEQGEFFIFTPNQIEPRVRERAERILSAMHRSAAPA
jgi:NAD(P)-dependent dehydrogenase (short-subunit alcohol dehydrogenase family)